MNIQLALHQIVGLLVSRISYEIQKPLHVHAYIHMLRKIGVEEWIVWVVQEMYAKSGSCWQGFQPRV